MSLELRPLVAEAKSLASTSATFIPRSAASRKTDAPVMPPPMTRRSNFSALSLRKIDGRERLLNVSRPIFTPFGRLLGVRRPGAALLSITSDQYQSGARPPHSKEALTSAGDIECETLARATRT